MGYKILVLIPVSSKSHKNTFDPIIEELVKREHQVTLVTNFNSSKPEPGVKTIFLEDVFKLYTEMTPMATNMTLNPMTTFLSMGPLYSKICHVIFKDPSMVTFLESSKKYDVVLVNAVMCECTLQLAHSYGIPIVMVSPPALLDHISWALNIPHPTSYIPFIMSPYNSEMTFVERFLNLLFSISWFALRDLYLLPYADEAVRTYVPNAASISDIHKNVSFVLVNSHFSMNDPRPSMPCMAEVGGMHCRPAKKLPKEFEKFVNDSGEDGFIVFSMGSIVQGHYLPDNLVGAFKTAFSQIKQRVIWKYETPLEGLSPNVMIAKWIPQQDLIGHPKCRLAITHGGLLSLQEVAYHGVPLLGVPFGADRDGNLLKAVDKGFADTIDFKTVTPEIIVEKMNFMLQNQQIKEKAAEISALLKDRPQSPVETAAYWIEYVIRHKGAHHLKSTAAGKLNFFQYFMLDVISVMLIIVMTALAVVAFVSKKLLKCCSKRFRPDKKEKQQ